MLEPVHSARFRVSGRREPGAILRGHPGEELAPALRRYPRLVTGDNQIVVDHEPEQLRPEGLGTRSGCLVHPVEQPPVLFEDLEMAVARSPGDRLLVLPVVVADPVQHDDRLRRDQQWVAERAVLVPARGEA